MTSTLIDHGEVLQRIHEFDEDETGGVKFVCSIVVFETGRSVFVARVPEELPLEGPIDTDGMIGVQVRMDFYPRFDKTEFHAAPELSPSEFYRKLPSLAYYNATTCSDGNSSEGFEAQLLLREARILEILRKSPHENIVTYYGCKVHDGRIVGLCLERLEESVAQRWRREGRAFDVKKCVQGVRDALMHIHGLELCHNDINPMNVMFRKDGCPVLIDFDSCQPQGETLTLKRGTEGWCDSARTLSATKNDMSALQQLEEYLLENVASSGQ